MAAAAAEQPLIQTFGYDPDYALRILDTLDAEDRLGNFVRQAWHVLEPGRPLIWSWHMDAICEHLEAITAGELRRLVINVPPGFSKSMLTNVLWPAWEWGPRNMPYLRYLSFAYAQNLTIRDNLRCRRLLLSTWYQERWGHRFHLVSDQNAKVRYDTNWSGFRMASSIGGTGTGERGDRIPVDDPNNVKESESEAKLEEATDWFAETLPSRTTDIRTAAIVVIQQRTAVADVTGHILSSDLGYEWLCLPMHYEPDRRSFTSVPRAGVPKEWVALVKTEEDSTPRYVAEGEAIEGALEWEQQPRELTPQDRRTEEGELLDPERFPEKNVEQDLIKPLQSKHGEAAVAGQLEQRPQPKGGSKFKSENFRYCDAHEVPEWLVWARAYDLAGRKKKKSPFSVGLKIAVDIDEDTVYIADVSRVKVGPGELVEWMVRLAEMDGLECHIDYPQDPGQAGVYQVEHMTGKLGTELKGRGLLHHSPETGDKEDRATPFAAQVEVQKVILVRGAWNAAFVAECVNFPRGTYKDQVDAASRGYARALICARRRPTTPVGPEVIHG